MLRLSELKNEWRKFSLYEKFEQVIVRILIVCIAMVIVDALVLVGVQLFKDFRLGIYVAESSLFRDIFGSILIVLILLEFNHSVAFSLKSKLNVIQAKKVILIAILVVVRKIILLDTQTVAFENMLGIGAVAIALGALYWLLRNEPSDAAT